MKRLDEALVAYDKGLKIDRDNAQILTLIQAIQREKAAASKPAGGCPPGMGGMGSMFGGPEAEAKLKANPRIAEYFKDPKFKSMWDMC